MKREKERERRRDEERERDRETEMKRARGGERGNKREREEAIRSTLSAKVTMCRPPVRSLSSNTHLLQEHCSHVELREGQCLRI